MTKTDVIKVLKNIVEINSFTANKVGVDDVGELLSKKLQAFQMKLERYKSNSNGDLFVLKSRHFRKSDPIILLSGHLDTVHPPESNVPYKVISKSIHSGPGISDMKGGLVTILYVVNLLEKLKSNYNLIITLIPDEETGSQTHKKILYDLYKQVDYAFVFESSHDKVEDKSTYNQQNIVVKRKGVSIYEMAVKGKSGHSAIIDKRKDRINAILETSKKIIEINKLSNYSLGTTINFGKIVGGITVNTIADECITSFDLRVRKVEEYLRVSKNLKEIANNSYITGSKTTILEKIAIPPMERNRKSLELINKVQNEAKALDIKIVKEERAGGSDANQIAGFKVGVIDGLGPIGRGGHTNNEQIYLPSIFSSAKLVANTIKNLLNHSNT